MRNTTFKRALEVFSSLFCALLIFTFLFGCGSSAVYINRLYEGTELASDEAAILMYPASGVIYAYVIEVNGKPIKSPSEGTVLLELRPGYYTIKAATTRSSKIKTLSFMAEPGHIYRLKYEESVHGYNQVIGIAKIDDITSQRTQKLIESARPKAKFMLQNEPAALMSFIEAAKEGQAEELRRLISEGSVNINGKHQKGAGWTALMHAAYNGHTDCVKLLIENKANVNVRGSKGWTSLMLGAYRGYADIVQLLIENGAAVNANYGSGTALERAEERGHNEVVSLLKQFGAK